MDIGWLNPWLGLVRFLDFGFFGRIAALRKMRPIAKDGVA